MKWAADLKPSVFKAPVWVALLLSWQKLLGMEMAEFKLTLKCMWNSETGDCELLADADEEAMQTKEDDDDDDDDES